MLNDKTCFTPNEGEVAAKLMDGEAVLINITTGMYHSTDGVGGTVWELIEGGHCLGQIVEGICARYDVPTDQAHTDVQGLVQQLVNENLVLTGDDTAPALPAFDGTKQPYTSPVLNSYKDMSELLALDPPMPGLQQVPWEENDAA